MKLKNIVKDVRALRDNGQFIEVGPNKIVEVTNPVYNPKVFEVVKIQKRKEEIKEQKIDQKEE